MEDLIRVIGVLIAASLFLLGLATFIELIEQLLHDPGAGGRRH